ncbi:MAG: hypothetical protein JXA30_22235 [Deltaproteobacteria bacterium]|nr:hypothetical protein [Deltaproteobacteria bacterium]
MKEKSLKGIKVKTETRRKEAVNATRELVKTEADVVKVADQVGPIDSTLTDVNDNLRKATHRVLVSAEMAGKTDAAKVAETEKAARDHRSEVEKVERRTESERQKADRIRPADPRILDGSAHVKVLRDANNRLSEAINDLKRTELQTAEQRKKSTSAMEQAIRRNKK